MCLTTPTYRGLTVVLTSLGWQLHGTGEAGTLWRSSDGSTVGLPYELTPDSYEWRGILERIGAP